jgi:Phage integrase family
MLYFEDFRIGDSRTAGEYELREDETARSIRSAANTREHGTTGKVPAAELELERGSLLPLPPPWRGVIALGQPRSEIKAQRGLHPIWVFPFRGKRIDRLNNNGWQQARQEAGLPLVRVHDLRHSFGARLRAAGVSAEDREALRGHAIHSMAGHYASADVGHLLEQANLIVEPSGTRAVLRIAGSQRRPVGERSHNGPTATRRTWFCVPSL